MASRLDFQLRGDLYDSASLEEGICNVPASLRVNERLFREDIRVQLSGCLTLKVALARLLT